MSADLGQTLAGLLNASFGNAVEIIVGVAALLHGSQNSALLDIWIYQVSHLKANSASFRLL